MDDKEEFNLGYLINHILIRSYLSSCLAINLLCSLILVCSLYQHPQIAVYLVFLLLLFNKGEHV